MDKKKLKRRRPYKTRPDAREKSGGQSLHTPGHPICNLPHPQDPTTAEAEPLELRESDSRSLGVCGTVAQVVKPQASRSASASQPSQPTSHLDRLGIRGESRLASMLASIRTGLIWTCVPLPSSAAIPSTCHCRRSGYGGGWGLEVAGALAQRAARWARHVDAIARGASGTRGR